MEKKNALQKTTPASPNEMIRLAIEGNADLEKLEKLLQEKQEKLFEIMPILKSVYNTTGAKPVIRYYESKSGLKLVYKDTFLLQFQPHPKENQPNSPASCCFGGFVLEDNPALLLFCHIFPQEVLLAPI